MRKLIVCLVLSCLASATFAAAEFRRVSEADQFMALVEGKTLTRPLIRLQVTREGRITGMGATWGVSGNWTWRDGYFCRDLFWGGDALGYNCQEVRVSGGKIRFTSDKGKGPFADFKLRAK